MTTEHPSQDRLGQTPGTLITDDDHMLAHNVDEEPVDCTDGSRGVPVRSRDPLMR